MRFPFSNKAQTLPFAPSRYSKFFKNMANDAFVLPTTVVLIRNSRFVTPIKGRQTRLALRQRSIITCCESPKTSSTAEASSSVTNSKKSESSQSKTNDSSERKPPFEIRGFSLANLFLLAGVAVTVSSFSSYISSAGTASATSLGFVYGVPILLIGCALKYAELQPIKVESDEAARNARQTVATSTQQQVYKDITRHRYGDEAHLSSTMSSLGLIPRGEACPVLQFGSERAVEGEYELDLVFYSVATPYSSWEERIDRFESFFGPNVKVRVRKVDADKRLVGLTIRSSSASKN